MKLVFPDIAPSTTKARRADGTWYKSPQSEDWDALVARVVGEQRAPAWEWFDVVIVVDLKVKRGKLACRVKQTLDAITRAKFWKDDRCVSSIVLRYGALGRNRTTVYLKEGRRKFATCKAAKAEQLEEARAILRKRSDIPCTELAKLIGCSYQAAHRLGKQLEQEGVVWNPSRLDAAKLEKAREIMRANPNETAMFLAKRLSCSHELATRLIKTLKEQGEKLESRRELVARILQEEPTISAPDLAVRMNVSIPTAYQWRRKYGKQI